MLFALEALYSSILVCFLVCQNYAYLVMFAYLVKFCLFSRKQELLNKQSRLEIKNESKKINLQLLKESLLVQNVDLNLEDIQE